MPRHRILFQSNPTWLKTGLAENSKTLLKYLWKTGRYDVAHYCTQGTSVVDQRLSLTPWRSFGCIPADPALIQHLNSDPNLQRNASYGAYNIDSVVKEWKPTIWIGSDDLWAFQLGDYAEKPWYKQIHSLHHITVDSVPVLDLAFEQAKRSKHYVTWAKFAEKEMKRERADGSMSHVTSIYGAMDTSAFSPITPAEKSALRGRFKINPAATVFLFVARNQLRKQFPRIIEGFSHFKRDNPGVPAYLHFHTSFSEKGAGFDIPKIAKYLGVPESDILCTYTCKHCGGWWVAPYTGEDVDCPLCKSAKSGITINIMNGVPASEMRYIYGLSDAVIQAHSSGGQELNACQGMLCGKPLAITSYACGEDYCSDETSGFVTRLAYHMYDEMGTSFFKAATDPKSIASFMRKVVRASDRDKQEIGERSREWAIKTFGIEAIGAKWEALFDSLAPIDWSTVTLTAVSRKDPSYTPPPTEDNTAWLKLLYKHILDMDVTDQDDGLKHWQEKLRTGMKREDIYKYFTDVARQELAKNQPPADFGSLLDNTGRRRGLFLIKESLGDVAICTSLFADFHAQYPESDLYVATDPKYHEVLNGVQGVHKVLAYLPVMENELAMIGQGNSNRYFDFYFHPGVATQRHLAYLGRSDPSFDVNTGPAPRACHCSSS